MNLAQKREELFAKQKAIAAIFAEAGKELDLSKVKLIEGDNEHKRLEIVRLNTELGELQKAYEVAAIAEGNDAFGVKLNRAVDGVPAPFGEGAVKSLGKQVTASEQYKNAARVKGGELHYAADIDAKDWLFPERKATMTTGAGWAPQAIRTGIVIPSAQRPIQVLDLLPSGDTLMNAVLFMEETTATSGAAEMAEAGAYAQSTFVFTERSSPVKKIGHVLPITDEQLEDVPQVEGWIDNRMPFFVRQRLDLQVIVGDGTGSTLTGLKNVAGTQTQAKGSDATPDAILKAIVKVRITGRAMPSLVVAHPTDWQNVQLLKTAEGVYLWGSPSDSGPARIWGLPVAQSDADSAGTAYVGDYDNFCQLYFRRGLNVQIGYNNDDFTKGQRSIRADVRAAFVVYRAAAFCKVTGL